ncbi:MAG: RNA polymerase sporulation sigma factor SigH [Lachnospiraceae bacterium]|nr:RNA polymerase sporulation sigma factor SigH [Lachnospiraceae bacterium]MDD7378240.1 RNA polymerase sporulation sigma factor SigH [Lachnospiraceae bacterium]MDY4616860.1 RNA polymerase sporulation sigma factor SigH [Lachnospiraceae bacterium]MDY5774685.1 RNA polymerase sporulation sigma factor SigH [Lachnospiraceae bacterium]
MIGSYDGKTDEELIRQMRAGDKEIVDYLMVKYKNLVRKKANAFFLIGADNDDLIQEGMIGLFKAIRDYQEEKEVSFYHFAELCISRQMYTAMEASQRKKHAPLNSYVSLYEETNEEGKMPLSEVLQSLTDGNPEDLVIDRENVLAFQEKINERLSKMERQVLVLTLQGLDYQQIAEIMEKPAKSIDNALQRIKGKLRDDT